MGYRYSGWMRQPEVRTVQGMIDKTFSFMFPNVSFKTFGTSRTDAKVSANKFSFQLTINVELDNHFIDRFNSNLPSDIKALIFKKIEANQNPLDNNQLKYYLYLFAFGDKAHPFSAAMIYNEPKVLNVKLMKRGAELFVGEHDFRKYCTKPSENTQFIREVISCEINSEIPYQANFFPSNVMGLHIKSRGFMRYQVRLIMGQLLALGRGDISIEDIEASLNPSDNEPLRYNAVGSGLILQDIETIE